MANCTTTLRLGGKEFLFKSDEDLNKFLYNNRERLTSHAKDSARFSEELGSRNFSKEMDPQEEKSALLENNRKQIVRKNKKATSKDALSLGDKHEGGDKDTITGTNVHKMRLRGGKPLVTPMTRDDYKRQELQPLVESGRFTESEASRYIDQLFNEIGRASCRERWCQYLLGLGFCGVIGHCM